MLLGKMYGDVGLVAARIVSRLLPPLIVRLNGDATGFPHAYAGRSWPIVLQANNRFIIAQCGCR